VTVTKLLVTNPILSFKLIAFFRLVRLYNLVRYIKGNEIFLLTGIAAVSIIFGAIGTYFAESGNPDAFYNIFGQCILVRHRDYHNSGLWRILPSYRTRKSHLIVLDVRSNRNNVDASCLGCIQNHCKKNQGSSGRPHRRNKDSN
jgi:hypothetical protein